MRGKVANEASDIEECPPDLVCLIHGLEAMVHSQELDEWYCSECETMPPNGALRYDYG